MSAIIQETGGPLREERAVDGKLKSSLEWPKRYMMGLSQIHLQNKGACSLENKYGT